MMAMMMIILNECDVMRTSEIMKELKDLSFSYSFIIIEFFLWCMCLVTMTLNLFIFTMETNKKKRSSLHDVENLNDR
jgi:hypothetical protein